MPFGQQMRECHYYIHCLFLLNPQKSIAEIVKQIKGSSSHFINQNNLIADKFSWQTGYAAYSVSESVVDKVYQYIKNRVIFLSNVMPITI